MILDVSELHEFYRSRLGRATRRLTLAKARVLWPDVHDQVVAGIGYAIPFLGVFDTEAARTVNLSPYWQGAVNWPLDSPRRTCLVDEQMLPLSDQSVERILMVHALENLAARESVMREIWRVLAPEGRLLVVVAYRRGLWSKAEHTPFGHGSPFSENQIRRLLEGAMFTPLNFEYAMHVPPIQRGLSLWSASAWERIGRRWRLPLPGVMLVDSVKQVYGGMALPVGRTAARTVVSPDRAAPARVSACDRDDDLRNA